MRTSKRRGYGGVEPGLGIIPPRARTVGRALLPENDPMIHDFYSAEEVAEMRKHREWSESLAGRIYSREDHLRKMEMVEAVQRTAEGRREEVLAAQVAAANRSARRRRPLPPISASDGTDGELGGGDVFSGGKTPSASTEDVVYKGGRATPEVAEVAEEIPKKGRKKATPVSADEAANMGGGGEAISSMQPGFNLKAKAGKGRGKG